MAGVYWGQEVSFGESAFLLNALLVCCAIGIVFTTVAALVQLARGRPVAWKEYGGGLLTSGLVFYGFAFLIALFCSPFILAYMIFFR